MFLRDRTERTGLTSDSTETLMSEPKDLFAPFQLGPITLRNRFIRAGANEGMVMKGAPTKALVQHHRAMAAGGVGLTTVAYGAVSKVGRTLPNQVWMRPEILPDLKALADAVHAEGGAISYQITHGGSFVTSVKVDGPTMSASSGINKAGVMRGNFYQRAMNRADMDLVAQQFVDAAKLCREAGFDAVEIHMGHGYLLNQFISPLSNKRRDEFGGCAEDRARFPAEVLRRVKEAVGREMAVLAKINVADGVPGGATADDAIVTARMLQQAGADLLVLSGGRNIESGWFMFGSNFDMAEMQKVLRGNWLTGLMLKASQIGVPGTRAESRTMMPSCPSPRPSSRTEQIMPQDGWPRSLAFLISRPPGMIVPTGATGTFCPVATLGAPQTISRISPVPISTLQTER